MKCQHSDICGNCSWMDIEADEQKSRKLEALRQGLKASEIQIPESISYALPAASHGRDRVDLIFAQGRYGFYQKHEKSIFEIQECPQMSVPLFSFFQKLQKIPIPISKGSLRLRVSPGAAADQKKGLWLDFANTDVQMLFEEKKTLHLLLDLAFVEIGQRRKKLEFDGARFRLRDPEFHPWTRTWVLGKPVLLESVVGGFSQTGDFANQLIIKKMEALIAKSTAQHWVEFGCGNGNLTLPLAGADRYVTALEYDELSLAGFQRTLDQSPQFKDRIQLSPGDFQNKKTANFSIAEGLLVNPPRSGIQNFLKPLLDSSAQKPQDLIYMSCFLDSFCKDGIQIQKLGYALSTIEIIDQFPQTPHFEILSLWKLS